MGGRRLLGPQLRNDRAFGSDDVGREALMSTRKQPAMAGAEDGQGRAVLRDDRCMRRTIDPDGQTGHHDGPGPRECRRDPCRDEAAVLGGAPGPDDRDRVFGRQRSHITLDEERRWR